MLLKSLIRHPLMILAVIICLAVGQCRDFEDCRSLYTSEVVLVFVPKDKDKQAPIGFKYMIMNNERYKVDASNSIPIHLNPAANSTTIYLAKSGMHEGGDDHITIFYRRYPSLLSPLCGAQQKYVLDSLETTFKEYKIIHQELLKKEKEKDKADVQIFY